MAWQSAELVVQKPAAFVVRKTAVPVVQKEVLEAVLAGNAAVPVARPGAGLVGQKQALGKTPALLVPGGQAQTTSSRRDVLVLRKLSVFGAQNLAVLVVGKPAPGKTPAVQAPKSMMQPSDPRKAFLLNQKPAVLVQILGCPVIQKLTCSSAIPDTCRWGIPAACDRSAGTCCRTYRRRRSHVGSPG